MGGYSGAALACAESLTGLAELGDQLGDDLWARPTDCPAWTVGQVYAHIVGLERWLVDGSQPYPESQQEWLDAQVSARDGLPRTAVMEELRSLIPLRHKQLANPTGDTFNPLLKRVVPLDLSLRMRAFDLWVHEQDIRGAVGMPGGLASSGAKVTRDMFLASLPRIVAKAAKAAEAAQAQLAASVRISVMGAMPFDVTVAVGEDGRGYVESAPKQPPTAHLQLDWVAFHRLSAGRGARADFDVKVGGDAELGERVLGSLNIAP